MPAASASIQPYSASPFTGISDGNVYKGNIDANLSIAGNVAGSLYVYPNSPVGMSVLVDDGWNIPIVANTGPFAFNSGSPANTVTLVAPGSNSYYACIYWDLTTALTGVIYGASASSPIPRLPDPVTQVPLAFVLIASTTTTITTSQIIDARTWLSTLPASFTSTGLSANTSVNCQGASAVGWNLGFTAAITVTLNALRVGVPVYLDVSNTTGGTLLIKVTANTPSGTAYLVQSKAAGASAAFSNLGTTGASIAAGTSYIMVGMSKNPSTPTLNLLLG